MNSLNKLRSIQCSTTIKGDHLEKRNTKNIHTTFHNNKNRVVGMNDQPKKMQALSKLNTGTPREIAA